MLVLAVVPHGAENQADTATSSCYTAPFSEACTTPRATRTPKKYYDLRIGPAYGTCDGFKSAFLLVDRPANTVRSLSFWGSNEALLASIADEQYQKVAKGLLQLVDPNTMEAHTFEVGAAVGSEG